MLKYQHPSLSGASFALRLRELKENDPVKVSVVALARFNFVRLVTYWELTPEDTDLAIRKIIYVIKEFEKSFVSKL